MLAACLKAKEPPATTDTGTDTVSTTPTGISTSGLPLWVYTTTVLDGTADVNTVEGELLARHTGATFTGNLLGPTLVAEHVHEIFFQLNNDTAASVDLTADGVTVVDAPTVSPGGAETQIFQTTEGPGVVSWHSEERAGEGLAGLVTIRDELDFPVLDIDETANIILFEPDPGVMEVNTCVTEPSTTPPTGTTDTAGACPALQPAPEGFTVLVFQRLTQVYTPEFARHGGPPNEFITSTFAAPILLLTEGNDVRLNVYNMAKAPHTLDLGGLPFGDAGAALEPITLQPGEGVQLTAEVLTGLGSYTVTCTTCDHLPVQAGRVEVIE
jgi:FtsP/CotA-like multicopper oxidase with cupredoxin domain